MSDKMSDVFELPVKVADVRFTGTAHVGSNDEEDAAATIAINEYDADQDQISELQKLVDHWISNHGDVVKKLRHFTRRPDITINKQQEEIKALKTQVEYLLTIQAKHYGDCVGLHLAMIDAVAKTPQQCLDDVRADAIKDAYFNSGKIHAKGGIYVCLDDLKVKIKQLRDNHEKSK